MIAASLVPMPATVKGSNPTKIESDAMAILSINGISDFNANTKNQIWQRCISQRKIEPLMIV